MQAGKGKGKAAGMREPSEDPQEPCDWPDRVRYIPAHLSPDEQRLFTCCDMCTLYTHTANIIYDSETHVRMSLCQICSLMARMQIAVRRREVSDQDLADVIPALADLVDFFTGARCVGPDG